MRNPKTTSHHLSNLCEACLAAPAADTSNATLPDRKTDLAEVVAVPVILNSTVSHIVDVTGVRFTYAVPSPITCSFPGNHTPHRSGLVADARCGVTLRVGPDCAETRVGGWDDVKNTLRKLGRIEAQNAVIEAASGIYQAAKDRVRGLSPWLKEAGDLPTVGEILGRMHNAQDAVDAAGSPRRLSEIDRRRTLDIVERLSRDAELLQLQLNAFVDRHTVDAIEQQRRLWERELGSGVRDYFKSAQNEHRRRR